MDYDVVSETSSVIYQKKKKSETSSVTVDFVMGENYAIYFI